VRPLDPLSSIKVKLGVVIVFSIGAAYASTVVGAGLGLRLSGRIVLATAVALVIVQLLAHGMISPLREMSVAARAMARGDYSRRVRATSRDEVGELARAFNKMAGELAEVDRQRRDLVAHASHELRTPITALQALLENIVDGVEEPDPRTLRVALAQTERLGRLVGQLLDLSTLESGAAALAPQPVVLAAFCDQAVSEAALSGRAVELVADVVPGDLVVHADPARLHQVLANLLDNASRHSPVGGRVTVGARSHGDGVRLWVSDEGPGIPAADRDRAFERFSRLDGGGTSRDGGGGLGLAIAREVVELHGGVLSAQDNSAPDTPPAGCRMVVDLPPLGGRAPPPLA